jgi:membrane-bound serine protease (ClpP class)
MKPKKFKTPSLAALVLFLFSNIATVCFGQEPNTAPPTIASLVRVSFPLTANVDEAIRRDIAAVIEKSKTERPIVILEFADAKSKETTPQEMEAGAQADKAVGRGTSFETALGLARWLTSPQANRAKCIAYLPQSIEGHAVLIALACEEIAAAPTAAMGRAAIDEAHLDKMVTQSYFEINQRRQALPDAAIQAMLDPNVKLIQVDRTDGGTEFVTAEGLEALRQEGKVSSENEVNVPGQLTVFQASQMRRWRWISHLVDEPSELQSVLKLSRPPVDAGIPAGPWKPVVLELKGRVNTRNANQFLRALEEATRKQKANLVFVNVDSPGGDLAESLRISHALTDLESREVHTVAFVENEARGDAALVAMGCDEVWMSENAVLGGSGEATIRPQEVIELSQSFEELAQRSGRDPVEFYGAICPELRIFEFTDEGGNKRVAAVELAKNADKWTKGDAINTEEGLPVKRLEELNWIQGQELNLAAVAKRFDISELPDVKRGSKIELFVQRIAAQAWLPPLLLFLAFVFFTAEMNSPGIGVLGFASALCFVAFFWIRFLSGTVEWLEILLFVGGFFALAIELFVFPGFGIFGFGGILMLGTGVVLASQTFILPTNNYQLNQMAWNSVQLASIIVGIGTGLYFIRKHLNHLPVFRRLTLSPAGGADLQALEEREAVVHWEHYRGKAGVTVTRCNPAGKARIGDDVVNVISDGIMIDEDVPVRVIEVRGNTVLIEPIE